MLSWLTGWEGIFLCLSLYPIKQTYEQNTIRNLSSGYGFGFISEPEIIGEYPSVLAPVLDSQDPIKWIPLHTHPDYHGKLNV